MAIQLMSWDNGAGAFTDTRELVSGDFGDGPFFWSLASDYIAVITEAGELIAVDLEGERRTLAELPSVKLGSAVVPVPWGSDGVVYPAVENGERELRSLDLRTGAIRTVIVFDDPSLVPYYLQISNNVAYVTLGEFESDVYTMEIGTD